MIEQPISLKEIQVIIQNYNQPACKELHIWLNYYGLDFRYGISNYSIDVSKNINVGQFLKEDVPKGKIYLLMIANDLVPLASTKNILTEKGDLLYAHSLGNEGRIDHVGNYSLSAACLRIHKKVLQTFGPPWFRQGTTGDLTNSTYCDCVYFRDRANENGWDARMVGKIGHEQRCILMPHPEEPNKKWQMMWPSAWNEKEICTPIDQLPISQEESLMPFNPVWRGEGTPEPEPIV